MTLTPAQAVAQVDSPRHDWDELSDHYKRHCREIAAAAIAAHKVLEANVPLAPPEWMPPAADEWEAYYAPPAPSFHPERGGTLGEVEVGDRFMWDGVWHEAGTVMNHGRNRWHVDMPAEGGFVCDRHDCTVRIQKRATTDEGPPAEMRLPSGDVAYQTIRAGEVVPGMWVAAFRPFDSWRQVTAMRATGPDEVRFEYGYELETFELDDKVKVASTVDGARLAAERKAMQAEAYDTACEART